MEPTFSTRWFYLHSTGQAIEFGSRKEARYRVAAFAVMPITRLVTVEDKDGGTHEKNLQKARQSSLPVDLVEA